MFTHSAYSQQKALEKAAKVKRDMTDDILGAREGYFNCIPTKPGRLAGYDVLVKDSAFVGQRLDKMWCRADTVMEALMEAEERHFGEAEILKRAACILEKRRNDACQQAKHHAARHVELGIAVEELRK